jgi:hypothetical protein
MDGPCIRIEDSGAVIPLHRDVTTVGRGSCVDVRLDDPSVSRLHAEIIRRGPYMYVTDLGLSRNGTRVNGRPIARRVLKDGDVLTFGSARCRVSGIADDDLAPEVELSRSAAPELTRRELDVVTSLCRPALSDEAFVTPGTAREIAVDLVVTEAAVKQHLLRLYQKLRIPEGPNRRVRLANVVVALGLVRPLPLTEHPAEGSADLPAQRSAEPPADQPAQRSAEPPAASDRPAGSPESSESAAEASQEAAAAGPAASGTAASGTTVSGAAENGLGLRGRSALPA